MPKTINLVVPEPDIDVGDKPVTPIFISPEGADPDREVPGFFVIQIAGEYVWPDGHDANARDEPGATPVMPRQFLSLDAVHAYLRERYGWKVPLVVTSRVRIREGGPREFPAIWGAERKKGRKRVQVRARYLGSFAYWDGRPVDPTKVGTARESILQ